MQAETETRYLELASRKGMEVLRRDCPYYANGSLERALQPEGECPLCQGRGWRPLPEAERLGALVTFAVREFGRVDFQQYKEDMAYCKVGDTWERSGPTPEAALVEALLEVKHDLQY